MGYWEQLAADRLAKIEELEETLRQFRDVLRSDVGFPLSWGLSNAESRILHLLAMKSEVRKEAAMTAAAVGGNEPVSPDTIRVHIHRMRDKLRKQKVIIHTVWGRGYSMPDTSRQIVKAALRAAVDVEK